MGGSLSLLVRPCVCVRAQRSIKLELWLPFSTGGRSNSVRLLSARVLLWQSIIYVYMGYILQPYTFRLLQWSNRCCRLFQVTLQVAVECPSRCWLTFMTLVLDKRILIYETFRPSSPIIVSECQRYFFILLIKSHTAAWFAQMIAAPVNSMCSFK